MKTQKIFTSLCQTILLFFMLSLVLSSCSTKEKQTGTKTEAELRAMTDEEVIQYEKDQANKVRNKAIQKAKDNGYTGNAEEEMQQHYEEQNKVAQTKEALAEKLALDKIASEKADQLEDEQRRLRNQKLLDQALEEELNPKEITYLNVADNELTEEIVNKFLTDFEKVLIKEQDIEKVAEFISSDAVITVISPLTTKPTVMNKTQYLKTTASSWVGLKNYEYKLLTRKITLKNGSVKVVSKQKESMDMFEETIEVLINENSEIEIRDGRLFITKVKADIKLM